MILTPVQFVLFEVIFIVVIIAVSLLPKILVMIDVFGWERTKELLRDPDWNFGAVKVRTPKEKENKLDWERI